MVSEQVMEAFHMEPLETKVKSLTSEQQNVQGDATYACCNACPP